MRSDYLSTIWSRTKPPHLLLFAAVWHLAVTVSIFILGRFQLMPAKFDFDGLGTFADDGFLYRGEITSLTAIIKSQGLWALVNSPSQLHVKLYAVDFALFGWVSNFNILTIEPLNFIYYLTILVLCYQLGHRLFNQRAGLIAAGIVAVWPSFVLHTTQTASRSPVDPGCSGVVPDDRELADQDRFVAYGSSVGSDCGTGGRHNLDCAVIDVGPRAGNRLAGAGVSVAETGQGSTNPLRRSATRRWQFCGVYITPVTDLFGPSCRKYLRILPRWCSSA